jgi:hypothetical protein
MLPTHGPADLFSYPPNVTLSRVTVQKRSEGGGKRHSQLYPAIAISDPGVRPFPKGEFSCQASAASHSLDAQGSIMWPADQLKPTGLGDFKRGKYVLSNKMGVCFVSLFAMMGFW